jgi:outer membrane lipoprotein-sorting protein
MQGQSNYSEMSMKIVRPTWQREVTFKSWGKGKELSVTLITSPAKDKGQSFLKRGNEMWNWNPVISRMIKLPPSMMSQGWMGSDYSNDDILKESSIVVDYEHTLVGTESIEGKDCYKIKMIPKETAAVVWGLVVKWISKDGYMQMKSEYYDEDNKLVRTDFSYDIKVMDGRRIPCRFEIVPADKKNQKTVVNILSIRFNIKLNDDYFTQQNMKNLK